LLLGFFSKLTLASARQLDMYGMMLDFFRGVDLQKFVAFFGLKLATGKHWCFWKPQKKTRLIGPRTF